MPEEKKKINKVLIAINIIAVAVIIIIACYLIFIKGKNDEMSMGGKLVGDKRNMAEAGIEDICKNYQERGQGKRPENIIREVPEGFDPNSMPREALGGKNIISEICEDGEVTEEEKEKFEEMQSNMPIRK